MFLYRHSAEVCLLKSIMDLYGGGWLEGGRPSDNVEPPLRSLSAGSGHSVPLVPLLLQIASLHDGSDVQEQRLRGC